MKKLFYIASFLFFYQLSAHSQVNIDWTQVASPDSSYREFRYMSKSGYLYFIDNSTYKTYASFDYGKTWELLLTPSYVGYTNSPSLFDNKTVEDAEGNLYFVLPKFFKVPGGFASNSSLLYKFDVKTKETNLFFDFATHSGIIDYSFIKDNELILTTSKSILLFDVKQGKLKKEISIKINSNNSKIYYSKGYKTYINIGNQADGSKNVFQAIDDTLGLVGSKFDFPYFFKLYYSKGRFFNSQDATYSDDEGKTWNKLKNFPPYGLNFEIGHNAQIFGENGTHYLYSKDNGDSFQILGDYDLHWITSDASGVLLKTSRTYCRNPKISYISHDVGDNWEEIRPNLNSKPYAQSVNAGLNGNLIAKNNCEIGLCYTKDENSWEKPLSKFNKNFNPTTILELPGGGLFVSENYSHYVIDSEFNSLTNCNFNLILLGDSKVKNDKLFMLFGNDVFVSEDFLNVKDKINFNGSGVYKSYIASNYRLIQKLDNTFTWRILDLKTKLTTPLQLPISTETVVSSYSGNNIYALSNNPTGIANRHDYYIHQSSDGGLSFAKILVTKNLDDNFISMHVDHNENIYILFDHKLFVSVNEGLTWFDITPKSPDLIRLTGISFSYDDYIYLSTLGLGIIRTEALNSENVKYVHVKAIRDVNFNCVIDTEDTSMVNGIVRSSSGYEKPLNIDGEAWVSFLGDSVDVYLDVNPFATVCNNNIKVHVDKTDSLLFLVNQKECVDLKIGLSTPFLRRCFDNSYSGFIKNEGSILSDIIKLNITLDTLFEFISSNLAVISYDHPYLKLTELPLEVGKSLQFDIKIKLKCDAKIGQEHCIYAEIDSRNPCFEDSSYLYTECRQNVGSFDPNDKAIFVAGRKDVSHFKQDDKIEYLIRFQNTGTDTAFTVKIEDYINSKFDITTLRPIAASHEFDWEIRPNRNLVVYFNNILLVDSFKNEAGSHGFIKFEIKLDSNAVMLGDTISNTANIFFDFNEAVVTNTVLTINGLPNNIKEPSNNSTYILYPNPTNAQLNIKKKDQISGLWYINLYNSSGMLLSRKEFNSSEGVLDLADFQSGFYIVKISSGKNTTGYKVVKL